MLQQRKPNPRHPGVTALIANTRLAAMIAALGSAPVVARPSYGTVSTEESFREFHSRIQAVADARRREAKHEAVRAIQASGVAGAWTATVQALRITVLPLGEFDLVALEGAAEAIREHLASEDWIVAVEGENRVVARRRGMAVVHPTDANAPAKWAGAHKAGEGAGR